MRRASLITGILLLACEITRAGGAGSLVHFPEPALYFEQNQGQAHRRVRFIARTGGASAYLLDHGAVFRVGKQAITLDLLKSRPVDPEPSERLRGVSSYFAGPASRWHAGVPHFAHVTYRGVYPGVDLHYYGAGTKLEYDLALAPGADPGVIRLRFTGGAKPQIDPDGELIIPAGNDRLVQHRPRVYQPLAENRRRDVTASYRVNADGTVSFELGPYDRHQPLIIDPVLSYSTYFGGLGYEQATGVRMDDSGILYIAGTVGTPISDRSPWASAPATTQQAAVMKFLPSTGELLYFVHLGGSNFDSARALALDTDGSVVVVGRTASDALPRVNAYQDGRKALSSPYTGFVTKIARDGKSMVYSTYFGGSGMDDIQSVALDRDGSVLLAGNTTSTDFPLRAPLQSAFPPQTTVAFLARLSADGQTLRHSTLWGGTGYSAATRVVVDALGSVYLAGCTTSTDFPLRSSTTRPVGDLVAFATRFAPDAQSVVYSVLVGGGGTTVVQAAAVDSASGLYIAGNTNAPYLPTTGVLQPHLPAPSSVQTGFIVRLAGSGALVYGTYLGGSKGESVQDLMLDSVGSLYAVGWTRSPNFPLQDPIRPYTPGGVDGTDAFLARLSPAGDQFLFSTLLGGSGDDYANAITAGPNGTVCLVGYTTSPNFPTRMGYEMLPGGSTDIFLSCLARDESAVTTAPAFGVSPATLAFTAVAGSAQPDPQTVLIRADPTLSFDVSATSLDRNNWLSARTSGRSASVFAVAADPSGLQPGRFGGNVHVAPTDGGAPLDVPVSLTVLRPAPEVTIVDPSTLPTAGVDITVNIYGSGFDRTSLAGLSLLDSSQYPIATAFVTPNLLRAVIPGSVLTQSVVLSLSVTNSGSASSRSLTITVGRRGPLIANQTIYGPSGLAGTIAPGEALTLHGLSLGPASPAFFSVSDDGKVPTQLGATRVLFDGEPAPMLFASSTKVSAMAPFGIASKRQVAVQVEYQGVTSEPVTLAVAAAVPGIFTSDLLGLGQGFITNGNGTINGVDHPAAPDSVIAIWASGGGQFDRPVADGTVLNEAVPLAQPVTATIDGTPCEVLYAGAAPGMVAGILQINLRIPSDARSGPLEVYLKIGDATSQAGVTVQVR